MESVASFVAYYRRIRHRTVRVAECIPPAEIEWRPADGRFSFGDLLRHLAGSERYMFVEIVCGGASRYPGHGPDLAEGHEAVMRYFGRLHRESLERLEALDDEALQRRCVTPAGASITSWKWLRAMVEHEVHHRGQIYTYLGLLGIESPPLFGLTSEEMQQLSHPSSNDAA